MFHFELRHFPANFARFNLTEAQLRSMILDRWTKEEWVEVGERKWNPQQAKLTVLEGPEIALDQLTMGRGWRNAQRHGRDVTEEILARARDAQTAKSASGNSDLKLESDSLGLEVLAELGTRRLPLRSIWELAAQRLGKRTPSQSLALAEGAVRSLLDSGLIVVLADRTGESEPQALDGEETDTLLATLKSWEASSERSTAWIGRS
jgi:hypothetical protein